MNNEGLTPRMTPRRTKKKKDPIYGSLCAAVLVFAIDVWMHLEIFVFPSSSTAALGLLFMPLWNLVLVIPVSYLVGSLISKKIAKQ